jgi:hypothetical protein
MSVKFIENAVGRKIPTEINGKPVIPFQGVGKYKPIGRKFAPKISTCANYPLNGNKLLPNLKEALKTASKPERSSYQSWYQRWNDYFHTSSFPKWRFDCGRNF